MALFFRLSVIITPEFIYVVFGIGLIRFRHPIKSIISVKAIEKDAFSFMTLGIKFGPKKIDHYSVKYGGAIELELKKRFTKVRIGCREPVVVKNILDRLIKKEPTQILN